MNYFSRNTLGLDKVQLVVNNNKRGEIEEKVTIVLSFRGG